MHPAVQQWFDESFAAPTAAQAKGWVPIAAGDSTLIVAPTGSGKTLAAFLSSHRPADVLAGAGQSRALPRALHLPHQGAGRRRRAQPARAAGRHRAASPSRAATRLPRPSIAVRTGDTPARERARFQREPADILITTPESLYLLLTSNAREALRLRRDGHRRRDSRAGADQARRAPGAVARAARARSRDAACSGSGCRRRSGRSTRWRGFWVASAATSHDARQTSRRDGASAAEASPGDGSRRIDHEFAEIAGALDWRPVTIVDAREPKRLDLRVEVPVEDMARLGQVVEIPSGPASQAAAAHVDLGEHPPAAARAHSRAPVDAASSSTAGASPNGWPAALNELAGEPLVRSHHGSIARAQRLEIEDALKAGQAAARWSRPRRSSSASTWAPSIW